MLKVFYHPDTLQIKGVSDGESSMDFPFIETDDIGVINNQANFAIQEVVKGKKKTIQVVCVKGSYTDEEWEEIKRKATEK